jgi:hypothetical protein
MQGSTATFSVSAIGASPLSYQWVFNDSDIPTATNSSYTVTGAQSDNAGSYSVIVTNTYGVSMSTVASLTVVTPPVTGIARNENGKLTLSLLGPPNTTARIWAATNLMPPIFWLPIFTNTNVGASGEWQFTLTNTEIYYEQFYRLSTP